MFGRLRILNRVRCFFTASQEWSGETYFRELRPCAGNNVPLSPISFLERAALVYREQTSVVYGSVRFTWPETLERCRRLASALKSLQIKAGDVLLNKGFILRSQVYVEREPLEHTLKSKCGGM